jgi:hypothetical protein
LTGSALLIASGDALETSLEFRLVALLIAAGSYAALAHHPSGSATQRGAEPVRVEPLPAKDLALSSGELPTLSPNTDPEVSLAWSMSPSSPPSPSSTG